MVTPTSSEWSPPLLREDPRLQTGPVADELTRRVKPSARISTPSYCEAEFENITRTTEVSLRSALRRIERTAGLLHRWRDDCAHSRMDSVVHAAAKDVRVNAEHAALNGMLDNSFRRLSPDEQRTNLGGDELANEWPKNSAGDFVALGKGHATAYWTEFLRARHEVDPDMMVNIEHEAPNWAESRALRSPAQGGRCRSSRIASLIA